MKKCYLVQRTAEGPGGVLTVSVKAFTDAKLADTYAGGRQGDLRALMGAKLVLNGKDTGMTLVQILGSFGVSKFGHPILEVDVHEADLVPLPGIIRPS